MTGLYWRRATRGKRAAPAGPRDAALALRAADGQNPAVPRIALLPPNLVNRIAAGECVERPASVVKELVENALDAGGQRIRVLIADGGRELIQVSDDGVGMDAEDLRLCVLPHATSKLRDDADLFNIRTMGFRGEALPSIGSVSRLRIVSRTRASDAGHVIRVDAGEIRGPEPCAAPVGTTVEVRDLFLSVPARRKFLRTNQTEVGHISEQLARIALAHPGIAFSLSHGGRELLNLPATTDHRTRIADCFSPEIAAALIPLAREEGGLRIEGLVAPPAESRGSGKWEYAFVNGRFVRDRFISHAVREAYRSLIDPSRYPVTFLFLTIDPGAVDVNVHPTKIELRWRDSNFVHAQVLAALREKFLGMNLDHRLRGPRPDDAERARIRTAMVEFLSSGSGGPGFRQTSAGDGTGREAGERPSAAAAAPWDVAHDRMPPAAGEGVAAGAAAEYTGGMPGASRGPGDFAIAIADAPALEPGRIDPLRAAEALPPGVGARYDAEAERRLHGAAALDPAAAVDPHAGGPLRAIQVHNTYLVIEADDGLLIIDQHALHERILYEELRRRISQRPLESQRLLLPDVVSVPPDRLEALETHADTLAQLGIELSAAGPRSVAVQAFPSLLERTSRAEFVSDLLDLLSESGTRPAQDTLLHRVLDMAACKAAVKAGDPLTPGEIEALLARRATAERSSHCPHGRPTTLHFSLRELEKQFKRR
ncbi:MAG: DNA mismatch repair endonuclease MutL [Planctomycetia bacterium]|nr:MAG: DNA mismatch repair endonuclease MutL [Planctomycetia bacterium]